MVLFENLSIERRKFSNCTLNIFKLMSSIILHYNFDNIFSYNRIKKNKLIKIY